MYIYIYILRTLDIIVLLDAGANQLLQRVSVNSSFGYLILDSVVAPHDKIDVSRQLLKTIQLSLKNEHGDVINLHGAHISFSLCFVTMEKLII